MNNCPKKIINLSAKINSKGYFTANIEEIDKDKCIGCASCAKICPDSVITIEKVLEVDDGEKDINERK